MKRNKILFFILLFMLVGLSTIAVAQEIPETSVENIDQAIAALRLDADILWTCIAAFLVFFMQAGFAMVESGFTRAKNASNIMMKNLMDFAFGSLAFWFIGAGIMFGANSTGFFGSLDLFSMDWLNGEDPNRFSYLIFQTVFAATAATIVSGAMAERTKFHAYLIYSVFITALIYPIFGSWAWNSLWSSGTGGWLEQITIGEATGFIDFAGSTVVHSIGAWVGLAGAIVIGARRGKYGPGGKVNPIPGHSLPLAALGVFILWLGWFGFNPGSTVMVGGDLATIAVVTNLAAAAGAFGSLITGWILLKKPDVGITLNGALAGLVAITAGCFNASPLVGAFIGFTAGIIVVLSVLMFDKLKIDDPVGAISVHGISGAWGTLLIGLLASKEYGGVAGGWDQFLIQLIGVASAFALAFGGGLILFFLIKITVGLRVSEEEEIAGLDIGEHGAEAYADFRIAQR